MNSRLQCTTVLAAALISVSVRSAFGDDRPTAISFQQQILPILSERCFACHGPDETSREADLRLDQRDDAVRSRDGSFVIRPGDPQASTLIDRITAADDDERMPPPDSGDEPLTPEQIRLLRRWIEQGAPWSGHWAWKPPQRPPVPTASSANAVATPVDAFVLARLEKEGLQPAPPADRETLIRRAYLDLLGLPPSPEQVDEFLNDRRPDAWVRLIDRLLDSPHYGERWARFWLDAARYADSDGFEKDKPRSVWFYRDWVIRAFNSDMPYDRFIIEQIAGDLLPGASQDQRVATGFLRNSMINEEGGIDPEEFRMQAMFDRMDAIGKSIVGITLQCGQCHNHKYEPFSQRDYYRMFAFLNNAHEAQPVVYTPEQQAKRQNVLDRVEQIERSLKESMPDWQERMARWETTILARQPEWSVLTIENAGDNNQRYLPQEDGSVLAQGYAPTRFTATFHAADSSEEIRSFRLEVLTDPNLPAGGPGRALDGQMALTEFQVTAESLRDPGQRQDVHFVRAVADYSNPPRQLGPPYTDRQGNSSGTIGPVEYAIDGDDRTAWGIDAGPGRRNQDHQAVFVADRNIAYPGGTKLIIRLKQNQGGWNSNDNQTLNLGRFRISVSAAAPETDPLPPAVRKILAVPADRRTPEQQRTVFSCWRRTVPEWQQASRQIERVWKDHPEGTTQLTLLERPRPRTTHVLERGSFLRPLEAVDPGTPAFLHPMPSDGTPLRLAFARWLVARDSPTTARAIVNRIWQAYFGTGLVDTPEDLGTTGSAPTHPDLLDWLAVELMDHDWKLRHVHRMIVLSRTYRQSSQVSEALLRKDPDNRLLARGARFRPDAEIVHDILLSAAGLLVPEIGGPSVCPPAPPFLFRRPVSYGFKSWPYARDEQRFRRALYIFRFRSVPYPSLQTFDAPSGEYATVRRPRTNTPLQSLVTLNAPLFFEAAQGLARRMLQQNSRSDEDRIVYGFRCCTGRRPAENEQRILENYLRRQRERFRSGTIDAAELFVDSYGRKITSPSGTDDAEFASWILLSRVLLNLDETITRG